MQKPGHRVQDPVQSDERRLFDERQRIPHSSPAMRLLGILLMLAGASVAALAQTNAPEVRKLSLEDCIQSALEKNLDLHIARYNPPLALSDLQAAYAGYNPNFTVGGAHNYSMTVGEVRSDDWHHRIGQHRGRKHLQQFSLGG